MGDRRQPTPPPDGGERPTPPPAPPPRVEVGPDGRARLERDLGLDINPKTGRAYASQGDAVNQGAGISGRFHDGIMVPRSFRCEACDAVVVERRFGEGFPNCGAIGINPGKYAFLNCGSLNLGLGGQFNLCGGCIERMIRAVPRLAGIIAAMNGGDLKRPRGT